MWYTFLIMENNGGILSIDSPSTVPKKDSHLVGIALLIIAFLFVIIAGIWLITGNSSKIKQTIVASPSAPEFAHISEELRSGDQKRIAAVTNLDPNILKYSVSIFRKYKTIVFYEKTFIPTPDGKYAIVEVAMTSEDGTTKVNPIIFSSINGKWLFGNRD